MKVAVLGCGPAGLLVAYAIDQAGHEPVIFSKKEKSRIPGSQHLHGPVPGLTSLYPVGTIEFVRIGTAEGYAQKVYGDSERATGWEHYRQIYPSWNVLEAYDKLWRLFYSDIQDREITPSSMLSLGFPGFQTVISTIPAPGLCLRPTEHAFRSVPYYIKQLPTPPQDAEHEIVVYNGLPEDQWYRWSILGGLCSVEYTKRVFSGNYIQGVKAIDNTCNCWPTIHRAGRWAEWKHGVTMHQAYLKAKEIAEAL